MGRYFWTGVLGVQVTALPPPAPCVADWNGDGRLEVVVGNVIEIESERTVTWRRLAIISLGLSSNRMLWACLYNSMSDDGGIIEFVVQDIDDDGSKDVAFVEYGRSGGRRLVGVCEYDDKLGAYRLAEEFGRLTVFPWDVEGRDVPELACEVPVETVMGQVLPVYAPGNGHR
jgi:hypothetical protein